MEEQLRLPDIPVIIPCPRGAIWLSSEGEIKEISINDCHLALRNTKPLICHRISVAQKLEIPNPDFPCYDILELFAFVKPGEFVIPTPRGLAYTTQQDPPQTHFQEAYCLYQAMIFLLKELSLAYREGKIKATTPGLCLAMKNAGWSWGPSLTDILKPTSDKVDMTVFRIWDHLEEWSDHAPPPPPGSIPLEMSETMARLQSLLGSESENRQGQRDYMQAVTQSFQPRTNPDSPLMVLAEAGTGTGKTLGYIAPSSLWAEKNQAPVWISTFTKNLQKQIETEAQKLYTDSNERYHRIVIRKGRENYLCLLNLEELLLRQPSNHHLIALGLIVRWIEASRNGDITGGDLPAWMSELFPRSIFLSLIDKRGECIYSACDHFKKCFVEKTIRRSRRADIVIANHALVMNQVALGSFEEGYQPTRLVFDEGHHLFESADSAFSALLSGYESCELRRWLLGDETTTKSSRLRGLRRRCEDLISDQEQALEALKDALHHAHHLPKSGWQNRILNNQAEGLFEVFLSLIRQQVLARIQDKQSPFNLECEIHPLLPDLITQAESIIPILDSLQSSLQLIIKILNKSLDDNAEYFETHTKQRIEALCRSIERRALLKIKAWKHMLLTMIDKADSQFIDWFAIERSEGRDIDIGYHRHYRDPMEPFAKTVLTTSHGVVITSATLRDGSGDPERDWLSAEIRTGARHLSRPAERALLSSPFDYPQQTKLIIITDVRKDDLDQVASAYRELFIASKGGALGLFTAISRLRQVHQKILKPLDDQGLSLLAQHIDAMDTGTLVDIFRSEEDSCLLGTDAIRDGVDVPGRSLRLIVFDRVPWPRPDILHKERRQEFGKKEYDDQVTRLKLKQAFGRLIRRQSDKGVFILLDPLMPSRLMGAFPEGVTPLRLGLSDAIKETKYFLAF